MEWTSPSEHPPKTARHRQVTPDKQRGYLGRRRRRPAATRGGRDVSPPCRAASVVVASKSSRSTRLGGSWSSAWRASCQAFVDRRAVSRAVTQELSRAGVPSVSVQGWQVSFANS
jgi:hypothetical protein